MEKIICIGLGEELIKCEPRLRTEYEIVGIINDDTSTWGKIYNNIPVSSFNLVNQVYCDFVLLTSMRYRELLLAMLRANFHGRMKILITTPPPFLSYEALEILLNEYSFETVLDIGSGAGMQTDVMISRGKSVTCIDKGGSIYFEKNKNVNVIVDDFNAHEFDTQFDCVWCSHVLEHQLNVHNFLRKVHSCLKEDGILAITVPPLDNIICSGHVTYWNAGMLMYNLVLAGFDCSAARIGRYGYNISLIVRKKTINVLDKIAYDAGDIEKYLRQHFPPQIQYKKTDIDMIFNGDLWWINWSPPNYQIQDLRVEP